MIVRKSAPRGAMLDDLMDDQHFLEFACVVCCLVLSRSKDEAIGYASNYPGRFQGISVMVILGDAFSALITNTT
jgi:hypothetical protein